VARPPNERAPQAGAFLLRLAGAVAGITFFFYLVGVAVEFRRLKTLHLPGDQIVSALPHDLLLIIGVRALLVPIALGGGAVLLVEVLASAEGWGLRRVVAPLLALLLGVGALCFILIPDDADLEIEHAVLVGVVLLIAAGGWLLEYRLGRITNSAALAFVATALAGAAVAYVHALLPPVHLDFARVATTGGTQVTGFYIGKSADDIFLTPNVTPDRSCGVLRIVPTRDVVTISVSGRTAVSLGRCPRR
jgi:hypothetical protein